MSDSEATSIERLPLMAAYRVDLFADDDLQTYSSRSIRGFDPEWNRSIDEVIASFRKTCKAPMSHVDQPAWRSCVIYSCQIRADGYTPTGNKTFDEARARSSGLTTGNVLSNVQASQHVRSYRTTRCNGFEFTPCELRRADLESARWLKKLSPLHPVSAYIERHDQEDQYVYQIFHHARRHDDNSMQVHGWLVTSAGEGQVLLREDNLESKSPHSRGIMDLAEYVIGGAHDNPVPVFVFRRGEEVDPNAWLASRTEAAVERPRG